MRKILFIVVLLLSMMYGIANAARVTNNLILLYDFTQTSGTLILDRATGSPKLDLDVTEPSDVTFLDPGLKVTAATIVKTNEARTKLGSDVFFTGGITIEAWLKPANNTQGGPARVISFSSDSGNRNFTFGQSADTWDVRFRTSVNPGNGTSPSTTAPAASIAATPALQHVVYTRDVAGNAKIYIDKVEVATESVPGDGSNWDINYGFGLFNELNYPTDVRTWLGEIFLVSIYGKDLTPAEITQNFDAGVPNKDPNAPVITRSYKITTTLCDSTTKITNTKFDHAMSWETFMNQNKTTDNFVEAPNTNPATKAEVSGMYMAADPTEVVAANLRSTIVSADKTRTIRIYKATCSSVFLE
jgi:hypothetical protein